MILHYLKMAWRNLLHYRAQAVISVAGLAAGFVCFTLANLWRVYETTYDTSYEGADRMYVCCMKTDFMESGYFDYNVYPLATWLKTTCPEVEQAAAIDARLAEMDLRAEDGTAVKGKAVMADSCFLQLFGIQILKGTDDFLRGGDRVALTESMARRLYGTTDVLGRKLTYQNTQATVCALVSSLEHTNFPYGILTEGNVVISNRDNWRMARFFIIVKLRQGVSAQEFQQKLADRVERKSDDYKAALGTGCYLCPLSEYRTSPMCRDSEIELGYLSLFAFIGGLVIVCALVNYLALFLTRLRIRSREIALRRVCGSSRGGVFLLLLTEYMLLLLLAGLVGMALVELFLPPFRRLSGVEGDVYGMSLLYFAGLVGVSVLFLLPVAFRRTPDGGGRKRSGLSYRLAVGVQMAVGILFIFCMSVLAQPVLAFRAAQCLLRSPALPRLFPRLCAAEHNH